MIRSTPIFAFLTALALLLPARAIAQTPKPAPNFFGSLDPAKGGLVGHLYDLKLAPDLRKPQAPGDYVSTYRQFVKEGFAPAVLAPYFRAPKPLYAQQIMMPMMEADEGPKAFGVEKEVKPLRWLAHYKGQVSPPADGVYHFVGAGDDVLIVRFNGKVVLDRSGWTGQPSPFFTATKNYHYQFSSGIPNGFAVGDALNLKADQFYDMEVLIGEQPGGKFFACLLVEQEGVKYDADPKGNPILPVFRLADLPIPQTIPEREYPPFAPGGPIWKAKPL